MHIGTAVVGETTSKIANVSIAGQLITWDFLPDVTGSATADTPLHIYMDGLRVLTCKCGDKSAYLTYYQTGIATDLVLVVGDESPVYDGYVTGLSVEWMAVEDAAAYLVYIDGQRCDKLGADTTSYTSRDLTEGPHYIAISSVDKFGNESSVSGSVTAVIYPLAPPPPDMVFYQYNAALWIKPVDADVEGLAGTLRIYANFCPPSGKSLQAIEEHYPWAVIDLESAAFPLQLLDAHNIDTTKMLFRTALVVDGRETKSASIQRINDGAIVAPSDVAVFQNTDGSGTITVHFSYDWPAGQLCESFQIRDTENDLILWEEDAEPDTFIEAKRIVPTHVYTDSQTPTIVVAAISGDGTEAVSDPVAITIDMTPPATPTIRRGGW